MWFSLIVSKKSYVYYVYLCTKNAPPPFPTPILCIASRSRQWHQWHLKIEVSEDPVLWPRNPFPDECKVYERKITNTMRASTRKGQLSIIHHVISFLHIEPLEFQYSVLNLRKLKNYDHTELCIICIIFIFMFFLA